MLLLRVNPFDLRTVLLAKHAQHVVLVHFPIALFMTGVGLDYMGQWLKRPALAAAAYINFLLAAVAAVPTAATGLIAWQWALEGQRLKGILLMHLVFGLSSLVLIWAVWWMSFLARRRQGIHGAVQPGRPWPRLGLELLAVAIVAVTGHLGGFLSGVNV
jgi:uncharacterized membrane protein